MKKRYIFLRPLCSVAITALMITSCSNNNAHDHDHEGHDHDSEMHDDHDHDGHDHEHESSKEAEESTPGGGALIHLEPEKAAKLGVASDTVNIAPFHETIIVGGRIEGSVGEQATVAARSAGILRFVKGISVGSRVSAGQAIASVSGAAMAGGDANESAQATLKAARRELDRLTPLHEEGIVTTREYNAALQAYESARVAAGSLGSTRGTTATSPTSGIITSLLVSEGEYVEAGAPIATVDGNTRLTLRADLPEKALGMLPRITDAIFTTSYSPEAHTVSALHGKKLTAGVTSGAGGYMPVYFTFDNDGTLLAGTNCEVTLLGGENRSCISVPRRALTEQQGQMFVFVQFEDDHYEKRPVKVGARAGDRYEILSGLNPGERVVTEGTEFVKLAENAGAAVPGHTHNH